MPTKIESDLSPEQLQEFLKRLTQLRGGALLKNIQALAEEFGVEVSLMGARSFKKSVFERHLEDLKQKREMAENVSAVAKAGLGLADAAAANLSKVLFDRSMKGDELTDDQTDQLSRSITRLRSGDQRAKYLEAKLADMEARLQLVQFDAAKAALKHATELRAIASDKNLDTAQRLEAARTRLFGAAPAGIKSLKELDQRKDLA